MKQTNDKDFWTLALVTAFAVALMLVLLYGCSEKDEITFSVIDDFDVPPPKPSGITISSNLNDTHYAEIVHDGPNRLRCSVPEKEMWEILYRIASANEPNGPVEVIFQEPQTVRFADYDPNDPIYKFIPEAPAEWQEKFGATERTRLLHSISELRVVVANQGQRILAMEQVIKDPNGVKP